jgi:hypothetical protein
MKLLFALMLMLPSISFGSFIFNYNLNYSSESESSDAEYSTSKTFHKILLGGAINRNKTLYLGWNINYWNSNISYNGGDDDNYSLQEMGPRLVWFLNENYNWYLGVEWNPYAVGTRKKVGVESDISGSSTVLSLGYRFKLSNTMGVGAGLHYHTLSLKEEKINDAASTSSDSISNIMPMLEFSFITK